MTDFSNDDTKQIYIIENQIKAALKEIEQITTRKIALKDAGDLEAIEREISRATDKLAGLITAQKIQQALDSEELKHNSDELVKAHPKNMKNQGPREVNIRPARGEEVTVKTSYYSQKGKKN